MRILLVEDEQNVAAFIKKGLEEEAFTVDVATDGPEGLLMATEGDFDLLILDVMLPGMDGIALCRALRAKGVARPILMLTAVDSVERKVEGLEGGADDYLVKPFAFSELVARIRVLLRRRADLTSELSLDDLRVDLLARRVYRGGKEIALTQKEFSMLAYFLRNKGRVLSRTQIIENVWGYDFSPGTNIVDVHVKSLREKMDAGFARKLIHTVRGVGYIMKSGDDA